MPVKAKFARLPLLLVLVGCSGGPGGPVGSTPTAGRSSTPPEVQVIFREGRVFAREGAKEWPIAEVDRDQMLWSPDGLRFAYFKQDEPASRPTASAEPPPQDGGKIKADALPEQHAPTYRIVIRNIRGDSVNEFAVYRAGRPSDLDWIDNETLGYVAPPDGSGETYVLHSTRTSEILTIYRGTHFVWSPGRKQLAYITNPKRDQLVKVDSQVVWPRGAMELSPGRRTRGHRGPTRRIQDCLHTGY